MKILVVCQHYWPEPYPLPDICEELVQRGHQVQVVTDVPNYPVGRIYPGYRSLKMRNQIHNGVRIRRTFTIGRRNNLFFRFLNYISFMLSSLLYVIGMKEEFDVVFANQSSPIIMSVAALAYGKKWHKKVVLYCMDLWPASLAAGGIKENSIIYKAFKKISRKIYRGADSILISSESFREYLKAEFQISDEKIRYHPQYADFVCGTGEPVEKDTVDLMFAGNVGVVQSIPTILNAAKLLEDQRQLRWHIVGDGSELVHCKKLAKELELQNVIFHGRKEYFEMPRYFAMADAMLLTLIADPFISLTLPRKAQTYLAAGKPVIGAANGEIAVTIRRSACGFCAEAEDAEGFAEAVRQFLAAPDKAQLGRNAEDYYRRNFCRDRFMENLETELASMLDDNSRTTEKEMSLSRL